MHFNQTGSIRTIAIIVVIILITAIAGAYLLLSKGELYFLSRGLIYASEKLEGSLPSIDGFNPDIHPVDPLIVHASFDALLMAINSDSIVTNEFRHNLDGFMTSFKNKYLDQIIIPDEQIYLADKLDSVVTAAARKHFTFAHRILMKKLIADEDSTIQLKQAVLVFDSMALFDDQVESGMYAPLSLQFESTAYNAYADNKITPEEKDSLISIINQMERFQLRDEFSGVMTMLRKQPEYQDFDKTEVFTENAATVLRTLRKPDFDFHCIKPTLRSFILLWNEQHAAEDFEKFDLIPLFEFVKYMRDVADQTAE